MMKASLRLLLLVFTLVSILSADSVVVLRIDGTINPATADYISRGIAHAADSHSRCIIIQLNTPGGLLKSTRQIVSDILDAPIPVIVYVSPSGAHAGSAGVFITLAAHVAAMAPATNIGAAHPVGSQGSLDSVMNEKATQDAAAFIRSIAERRHRNLGWAEEAVTKSVSITESEALKKRVIDLVAIDLRELLQRIDGMSVVVGRDSVVLQTRTAAVEYFDMDWAQHFLDVLSDPNIAYLLFLLGLYGLLFELYNPGAILPGVVGGIAIILALYSMHTLPVNFAGVALILFAVILFVLEIKIVSHGVLGLGGTASLIIGSLMLFRSDTLLGFVGVSWSVIATSAALTAFFILVVMGFALRAQRQRPTTGIEGLVGATGKVVRTLAPQGLVRVHGETWNARTDGAPLPAGTVVRIVDLQGLTIIVQAVHSS